MTLEQRRFCAIKKIKVGSTTMFPRFGFSVFAEPNYASEGMYMDTNPFTKSLDRELFEVKEITANGFVRGNFYSRPKGRDFYIAKSELEMRGAIETILLLILCFIPCAIYNLFK